MAAGFRLVEVGILSGWSILLNGICMEGVFGTQCIYGV